ncbi:MAG TPA: IPTL-CTERM sorting domain-containing protein, partial [Casimicrobiaceae bacterium]
SISGNVYAVDAVNGTVVWSANVGPLLPPPDEQNISQPLTGFGAGDGLLVIPAGNTVTAFAGTSPPMTATVVAVPALSQWMLAALAMLIAFATMTRWRPRPRRSSTLHAN